jgi:hypothetical protein
MVSHSYQTYFGFSGSDLNLDCGLHDHVITRFASPALLKTENPYPMNFDSRRRSIRMTPRSQLFFDKSFFSSLENQGREIITPTHNKCGKKKFIDLKIAQPYMSGYALSYSDFKLK